MRNSASQLADGLHLFRLPNPVFRGDLVGEVPDESVEDKATPAFSAR